MGNYIDHENWKKATTAECERRFWRLVPTDETESHWRILNSQGAVLYPEIRWGATIPEINGFLRSVGSQA